MALLKKIMKISQDFYPEMMGKLIIINAPFIFSAVFAVVKGWVDEKTRKKVSLLGSNYLKNLQEYIDNDNIPTYFGGTGTSDCNDGPGPWDMYETVESQEKNATVGVKRTGDPHGKIFTPTHLNELENLTVPGRGAWGTKGAVLIENGLLKPNQNRTISSAIENEELFCDVE